jgi:hypothetical protein
MYMLSFLGNPFPVGARVVSGGWVGLYGRPRFPYWMMIHVQPTSKSF